MKIRAGAVPARSCICQRTMTVIPSSLVGGTWLVCTLILRRALGAGALLGEDQVQVVPVTGTVASDDIKTNVERIVYSVPNVKKIADEVSVGAFPASSVHRTDSSITRDIKSGIGKSKALQSVTMKVATERGIVYLLGLATHAEADAASEIASTTSDVKKVVRVFEYID